MWNYESHIKSLKFVWFIFLKLFYVLKRKIIKKKHRKHKKYIPEKEEQSQKAMKFCFYHSYFRFQNEK